MTESQTAKTSYLLGHSGREVDRLKLQAQLIDPLTRRYFIEAGLAPGMRVLDVGSGAGDVSFLAGEIVGPQGQVIGVDRAAPAIQAARERALARNIRNVEFVEGDPAELQFENPFDAIVGRYVLQFQNDPSAMLRKLMAHLKPGGIVVFHEIDWGGPTSSPAVPAYDQNRAWGAEAMRLQGTETEMGRKLFATFIKAGLLPPKVQMEALALSGESMAIYLRMFSDLMAVLLPQAELHGVATSAEIGIETLAERIDAEAQATSSVIFSHLQFAANSRKAGEDASITSQ